MTMQDMVTYLEVRGFKVVKRYDPSKKLYTFTISNAGHKTAGKFKYPEIDDYDEKDNIQRKFLEELIDAFNHARNNAENDMCVSNELSLAIKDVIFNPPATIVFWEDGTKTVVKDQGEGYDPEKGLAMAISKKALGNHGNYYKQFAKWVGEFEKRNCEMAYPEVTFPLASELKKTFERIIDERIYRLKNKQIYSFHQEPIVPVNPNYGFINTQKDEKD